jgi:DNA topoisomerase-1
VPVTAQNGRYGPYLKQGPTSRPLPSEEAIFTIGLDQAQALLAAPATRGGGRETGPVRQFGTDPVSGAPVTLKSGRFGPYVTDGTTNATLRKADSAEELTAERAYELLAEKRAKPATTRPGRRSAKKA